jgi:phosphinothricin acetyltransferase
VLRRVSAGDGAAICSIYNYYIENTVITFEEDPLSVEAMTGRIREISAVYPWFVWEEEGEVTGYAYLNKWKERIAYRYSAEDSIYIKRGHEGRGIGGKLLSRLLEELPGIGIHAVTAVITVPNDRSAALHEKFGFKKAGRLNEIGFKMNRWLDVGYWELLL